MNDLKDSPDKPQNLILSLDYLGKVLEERLRLRDNPIAAPAASPPSFFDDGSAFSRFLYERAPTLDEYLLLLLALAPHLQPDFLTNVIRAELPEGGDFPLLGGVKGTNHRGMLPTGETAQFLLAGNDLGGRIAVQRLLGPEHWFAREGILRLEPLRGGEPAMSGRLLLDPEWVEKMTTGRVSAPLFSTQFPAECLQTALEWADLVLPEATLGQVMELEAWVRHHQRLLRDWGMGRLLKPGFRALFHGPPGTGKTLTATLIGKQTQREVYRVDLSMLVSKFIGETEKNLAQLFDKAQNKDWILFFDEADALFGKRTEVRDAHDKYANQEVSYLLQRVESFPGLVILASNLKTNIDEAFMRRFQSVVYFPFPRPAERRLLWEKALPLQHVSLQGVSLDAIAQRYELSGAGILNVVQFCCLRLLERGDAQLQAQDIHEGATRELAKEGKIG
jgi:Cdc6-like AAA superfamily ATPase